MCAYVHLLCQTVLLYVYLYIIVEKGALAEAECQGNYDTGARWGPVTFRDVCKTTPDLEESESTASLKNLSTVCSRYT